MSACECRLGLVESDANEPVCNDSDSLRACYTPYPDARVCAGTWQPSATAHAPRPRPRHPTPMPTPQSSATLPGGSSTLLPRDDGTYTPAHTTSPVWPSPIHRHSLVPLRISDPISAHPDARLP